MFNKKTIETEIKLQEKMLENSLHILKTAPKGYLFIRERKDKVSYYQIFREQTENGLKNVQKNISKNPMMIRQLLEKKIAEMRIPLCRTNIQLLNKLKKQYKYTDSANLLRQLPEKYHETNKLLQDSKVEQWRDADYTRCKFDPKRHIHETLCGQFVRSKSEVIIANALYTLGIPFHYEEQFPHPDENGIYIYPDFVILLPNGEKIYWEHLGLLSDASYCTHNAKKLHHYQIHGVHIGKNLILTQDDDHGSCNSVFIYKLIETYILPYFK